MKTRFSQASLGETISWVANSMAIAEPDIRVVRLISWLFDVEVREVRAALQAMWAAQRATEQNDRDPSGGKFSKRFTK